MNEEAFDPQIDVVTKEKLIQDLKVVVRDAEELLKATAGELGERTKELRARLATACESARVHLVAIEEKAVQGARAADRLIREHPYPSLGVAFGIGVLVGVLLNRK